MITLAHTIKTWSSCIEGKQHGCVLAVDGKYIVSTGFNGIHRLQITPPNCLYTCITQTKGKIKDGCESMPEKCDAIHAEINAITNAARIGADLTRCWAYITKQPCEKCRSVLINSGIVLITWDEPYRLAHRPRKDGVEVF